LHREIDKDIRDIILKLRVEQYEDYNIQHFQEKLVEKHSIKVSYTFLRGFLLSNLNWSPRAHKNTRARIKELLLKNINQKQN
jgi:hypothetical protein